MSEDTLYCANVGDILFFHDRQGYRNSRPENIGFHVQLPDYVVIDELFLYDFTMGGYDEHENDHTCSLVGIKRKKPAITDDEFRNFFHKVGNIDDQGYDLDYVQKDPHEFSRGYAAGFHEDEGFLNDLMRTMENYDPHKEENIQNINRILETRQRTGKLYPTEMAAVANHMIAALYKAARIGNKGKCYPAFRLLVETMLEGGKIASDRSGAVWKKKVEKPIDVSLFDAVQ